MSVRYKLSDLLTLQEMAGKLRISIRTVRDWIYKRKIPFTRLGHRLYVSAGVVEDLLNANAIGVLVNSRPVLSPSGKEVSPKGGTE
jgi:excisionase family DNA binding protein